MPLPGAADARVFEAAFPGDLAGIGLTRARGAGDPVEPPQRLVTPFEYPSDTLRIPFGCPSDTLRMPFGRPAD